jgi:hypothetical protein
MTEEELKFEREKLQSQMEMERARLRFEKEKWNVDQRRAKADNRLWKQILSAAGSPFLLAVIGVIGAAFGAVLQGYTAVQAEREKLRSSLILKAIETPNQEDALRFLQLLRDTKLVTDIDVAVKRYEKNPERIPLRPEGATSQSYVSSPVDNSYFQVMPPEAAAGSARGYEALRVAVSELNAGIAEDSSKPNGGEAVQKYRGPLKDEVNFVITPWNVFFISWCFAQHPKGIPFTYTGFGRDLLAEFQTKKWVLPVKSLADVTPGDILFFTRGAENTFKLYLVHHVSGDTVYAITGNTNNRVQGVSIDRTALLSPSFLGLARVDAP